MDGFGPTMSLASLVSWQDMLCYSPPPPHCGDGVPTPPEAQDALEAKKKKTNARGKLITGIQAIVHSGSNNPSEMKSVGTSANKATSPHPYKKLWIVSLGKASTFNPSRKPKNDNDIPKRRGNEDVNPNESDDPAAPGNVLLEQRMSVADSEKSHETLWRRSVSSPSISSSYTSLSIIPGPGSRNSSWDYRGSVTSIPRGSVVSVRDMRQALRANLTGNLSHVSKDGNKISAPSLEGVFLKRFSHTPTHAHVHGMFSTCGHDNPFHLEPASPSPSSPRAEAERPSTSRTATPTRDGRRPSIVRKDHMDIYGHPYFDDVAPGERHKSLSSLIFGSRSGNFNRRSTMDSIGSYETALDGTDDTTTDASFASF
ncbi:hypothetical protein ABW20_dc0101534 [Dactylellina cionopaga]|nr:hypothetical protein ABW20_dc0101534 [Dactylellina cionopaga]